MTRIVIQLWAVVIDGMIDVGRGNVVGLVVDNDPTGRLFEDQVHDTSRDHRFAVAGSPRYLERQLAKASLRIVSPSPNVGLSHGVNRGDQFIDALIAQPVLVGKS